MINWKEYIPHTHTWVWIILIAILFWKLNSFVSGLKEMLSEKTLTGGVGKISSKRVIIFFFTFATIYVWIYSMHAGKEIDHPVFYMVMLFIAFGLAVISPEQAQKLMDNLKGLAKSSADKKNSEEADKNAAPGTS